MKSELPSWADNAHKAGSKAVKNALITITSGAARFLASILTALILGRLLTPEDFGLVGMVLPIMALMNVFSDGGVSHHTLQVAKITHKELSLTFWLGAFVCLSAFLLLSLSAPGIAYFYSDARLGPITLVLAATLLINIFTIQHNALVKKCFRQDIYAYAEIAGACAGLILGISIAYMGGNYWAIVAIPLGRHFSHALVLWSMTGWVPGKFSYQKEKASEILSFGWYMTISAALTTFSRNVDKILIGAKFDATELGFYTMAYSIMAIPFLQVLTPVGGVAVPYLSQLKNDPQRFMKGANHVCVGIGLSVVPIMLWASYYSEELIVTILGEKWLNSAEIFSFLALSSISLALYTPPNWSLLAAGKAKELAKLSGYSLGPIIASYVIGLNWGAVGVAASYFCIVSVYLIFFPYYASRHTNLSFKNYLFVVTNVILSALLAIFIAVTITDFLVADSSHIVTLIVSFIILIVSTLFCFGIVFGRQYRTEIKSFINKIYKVS